MSNQPRNEEVEDGSDSDVPLRAPSTTERGARRAPTSATTSSRAPTNGASSSSGTSSRAAGGGTTSSRAPTTSTRVEETRQQFFERFGVNLPRNQDDVPAFVEAIRGVVESPLGTPMGSAAQPRRTLSTASSRSDVLGSLPNAVSTSSGVADAVARPAIPRAATTTPTTTGPASQEEPTANPPPQPASAAPPPAPPQSSTSSTNEQSQPTGTAPQRILETTAAAADDVLALVPTERGAAIAAEMERQERALQRAVRRELVEVADLRAAMGALHIDDEAFLQQQVEALRQIQANESSLQGFIEGVESSDDDTHPQSSIAGIISGMDPEIAADLAAYRAGRGIENLDGSTGGEDSSSSVAIAAARVPIGGPTRRRASSTAGGGDHEGTTDEPPSPDVQPAGGTRRRSRLRQIEALTGAVMGALAEMTGVPSLGGGGADDESSTAMSSSSDDHPTTRGRRVNNAPSRAMRVASTSAQDPGRSSRTRHNIVHEEPPEPQAPGGSAGATASSSSTSTTAPEPGQPDGSSDPRPPSLAASPPRQPLSEQELCIVCQEKPRNASFIHGSTAHIVCCYQCAMETMRRDGRCPMCRQRIDVVVRNYT
ncbi:unnamed protein product [Amoebophrya sp. A25]|nr:unnamed protein product [Amoebophrya sp. A25]|eukprot:GSA25T00024117001.1